MASVGIRTGTMGLGGQKQSCVGLLAYRNAGNGESGVRNVTKSPGGTLSGGDQPMGGGEFCLERPQVCAEVAT